jgi:hypothetical protein
MGQYQKEFLDTQKKKAPKVDLRLQDITADIMSVIDGFCCEEHANGPACNWGGAMLRLGVQLARHCPVVKSDFDYANRPEGVILKSADDHDIRAQGLTLGGSGPKSKVNTRLVYMGVLPEKVEDNPLTNDNFTLFDKPLFNWIDAKVKGQKAVPCTKCRHDYGLGFEEIMYVVGEAKSTDLSSEMVKILVALAKILCYSDVAWGIISTAKHIYIIKAWLHDSNIMYKKRVFPVLPKTGVANQILAFDRGPKKAEYIRTMMMFIEIFARMTLEMEFSLDSMIARQFLLPKDHPYLGRVGHTSQSVEPYDCVLYTGATNEHIALLPKSYMSEVYNQAVARGFRGLRTVADSSP